MQEEGSLPEGRPRAVCTSEVRKIRVPLVRAWEQRSLAGLVAMHGAERINCFRFGVCNPRGVADPLDCKVASRPGAGPALGTLLERGTVREKGKPGETAQFNCFPHDASSNSQLRDSKCQPQCNREKRNSSSRRAINRQIIQMTIRAFSRTNPTERSAMSALPYF